MGREAKVQFWNSFWSDEDMARLGASNISICSVCPLTDQVLPGVQEEQGCEDGSVGAIKTKAGWGMCLSFVGLQVVAAF